MKAHIKDPGKDAIIDVDPNRKTRRAIAKAERKAYSYLKNMASKRSEHHGKKA